jgi:hypothetical protein
MWNDIKGGVANILLSGFIITVKAVVKLFEKKAPNQNIPTHN